MVQITFEDLVYINDWSQKLTDTTEITEGIREENLLKSIPEAINQTFGGEELYPTVYKKAAYIWEKLSKYHCFIDGNKRTALATTIIFMGINNYSFHTNKIDLYDRCIDIASSQVDIDFIEEYLKAITTKEEVIENSIESILNNMKNDKVLYEIMVKLSQ